MCCLRYVEKLKTFIYAKISFLNHLPTNTKKFLRYFYKNDIVTSHSVIQGTPFFVNLYLMHF